MKIGLYAYQTFGKTDTNVAEGLDKILRKYSDLDILATSEYTNVPLEIAQEISQTHPRVLLFPGTTLVKEGNKIFNRAFVLKNGELIKKYDKKIACARKGYSDIDHYPGYLPKGVIWGDGITSGVFLYEGKKIGIEICRDNSPEYRTLQREAGNTLDLQVVLGCGMLGIGNALNEKGFCLAIDGEKPVATLSQGIRRIKPDRLVPVLVDKNDKLYIYSLDF